MAQSKRNNRKNDHPNGGFFHAAAQKISAAVGHPLSFSTALIFILAWFFSGPLFNFSDTWQLIVNTTTTIITFLMVFIIQNTQNRDAKATQLKLDELIRVHKLAHNSIIDLDKLTDEQVEEMEERYKQLSKKDSNPSEE